MSNTVRQYALALFLCCPLYLVFAQNKSTEAKFIELTDKLTYDTQNYTDEDARIYFEGLDLVKQVSDSSAFHFYTYFHWYFNKKQFSKECLKMAKKALPLAKKLNEYYQVTSIGAHITRIYTVKNQLDSAMTLNRGMLQYYKDRLEEMYVIDPKKGFSFENGIMSAYNNVGIYFYETLKQSDSAFYYFNKARELPPVLESSDYNFLLHSVNDNIALIYMDEGNYGKAKELFLGNFLFYKNTHDYERFIRAIIQWAQSEIHLGQLSRAEELLSDSKDKMDSLGTYRQKIENEILFSKTMALLYQKRNEYVKSSEFYDKTNELIRADVLEKQKIYTEKINRFSEIGIQWRQDLFNKEKTLRENEKIVRQSIIALLIASLLVLITFFYLLYKRNKLKLQKAKVAKHAEEERAELALIKSELLQKEVEYKQKDLALFANTISENRKWGVQLLKKIKTIKKSKYIPLEESINDLEKKIKDKITIEQDNLNFNKRIDILNSKFYENLIKAYPKLTRTELKLCSLIRLNLGNSDIAIMQNISKDSVYRSRTRLRKKLNLPSGVDLNIFLKDF